MVSYPDYGSWYLIIVNKGYYEIIWSSNLARCSFKNFTAKYQLLSNTPLFLGETEAWRAGKCFGEGLRPPPPPPPLSSKGLDDCPSLISRFGSGSEYLWIAIIKTKSETIAFLSSPPIRFSSLFLLFFFLFLRWYRDYRANQAQKICPLVLFHSNGCKFR